MVRMCIHACEIKKYKFILFIKGKVFEQETIVCFKCNLVVESMLILVTLYICKHTETNIVT